MITESTIENRLATVAYITRDFEPVEPDEAEIIKVTFHDNGEVRFASPTEVKRTDRYADWARFPLPHKDRFDPSKHPRDPKGESTGGRFAGGPEREGGEGVKKIDPKLKLKKTGRRAWNGFPVKLKTDLSKLETGELGENVALAYLQQVEGNKDAKIYGLGKGEKAVDMIADHLLVEVKAGLASNNPKSNHWRTTEGQPGPAETEWRKTASAEAIRKLGDARKEAIIKRKLDMLKKRSNELGVKLRPRTIASIINPDTKTVDLYMFDGFHSRVGWKSELAEKSYVGSFTYG